ncbi:MAG TPA: DoxX family protein [Trebonia sp.]
MNIALWIIAAVVALVFLASGLMKVTQPTEKLVASGMKWAAATPRGAKALGALEVLAAIGLILPPALGIAPVLAPLAAVGVAVIMIGAIAIHVRQKEIPQSGLTVLLLVLAVLVAWGRFGPYHFG